MRFTALLLVCLLAGCSLINPAPGADYSLNVRTPEPAVPWKLFNEPALLKAVVRSNSGRCNDHEIFHLVLRGPNADSYAYIANMGTGQVIWIYDPKPSDAGSLPTWIGFSVVDPAKHNEIPPIRWERFNVEQHNYICALFNVA